MGKRTNLLNELPRFSPKGEEVYQALLEIQRGDERIELFAKRAARAIGAHEAGNLVGSGPLERFLLCGTPFSSIRILVEVLAEKWLGKPWDGSSPFIFIDCGSFHNGYQGMLASLIGPLPPDELGFQTPPLFAQVEVPHLKVLRGEDLRLLQEWSEGFEEKWRFKIEALGGARASEFSRELRGLTFEAWRKMHSEEREKQGSFGSVIFFYGIDRASQSLHELVLQIFHTGILTLANGSIADFSNSIVIASITIDEQEVLRKRAESDFIVERDDALNVSGEKGELSQEYHRVRKHLLRQNGSAAFVQSVAENLIIVSERTYENQKERVRSQLQKVKERFNVFGVDIEFTDECIEEFVKDTKEIFKDGASKVEIYTEERVESGVKRHVLDVLNRLILFTKLRCGVSLRFDCEKGKECSVQVWMEQEGTGDLITPSVVKSRRSVRGEEKDLPRPEWLGELDKKAKEFLNATTKR